MTLSNYGVTLKRLTEDKIELVRSWRNDPKISQYMEYKEHITAEMQANWFKKIDNENNHYFIIEHEDKDVGLINIRDVDFVKQEGEGGIFIYDDELLNSTVSFQAVLVLLDFGFQDLELKQMVAHILKDNKRAIQYNRALGFKMEPNQEEIYNQRYTLNREDYAKRKKNILKLLNL